MADRAGRWLRVSRGTQDEANQETDIDKWITDHGYEPVKDYRLRKSAYKGKHQAVLDEVIRDMQDGVINVLVVWLSSRIERRGAYNVFDLARRVQQAEGRIEYVKEPHLNIANDMSDMMLATVASTNNLESKNKSKSVRASQDRIRKNNGVLGKLPYGYDITGDKYSKRPVINQTEAKVVREAVDRYLGGESLQDICDDFNARGVPFRGRKWIISTLARLLRNPAIAGRQMSNRDYGERVTVLEFDPIITWSEHEQLEARLDSRAHRKGISPKNVFMLSGIIRDANGHPMYGKHNRASYSYACRKACSGAVPVIDADRDVSEELLELSGHLPHMTRRVVPGENYSDLIARKRLDIRELDPEAEDYDSKLADLRSELARLRSLSAKPDQVKWVPSGKTIRQHWDSLTVAGKRDWLLEHGYTVIAHRNPDDPRGWSLGITHDRDLEDQLIGLGFPGGVAGVHPGLHEVDSLL